MSGADNSSSNKDNKKSQKNNNNWLKEELKKINRGHNSKIRSRILKDCGFSLYLDTYHGDGTRTYTKLNQIKLSGRKDDRERDKETLRVANLARIEVEKEEDYIHLGLKKKKSKIKMLDYFQEKINRNGKVDETLKGLINKYLSVYLENKKDITLDQIDVPFVLGFIDYLRKQKLAHNTIVLYFRRIHAILNLAVVEEKMLANPIHKLPRDKRPTMTEAETIYLTMKEIEQLIQTPDKRQEICDAYIFACFTGLRISDLRSLTYNRIQGDHITVKQVKTEKFVENFIHPYAKEMIEKRKTPNTRGTDLVFNLPSGSASIKQVLERWRKNAGIEKPFTFHSSRHTFATLAYTENHDIYTVKELLGHANIDHTMRYAKLINSKRDEAIRKMPMPSVQPE